MEEKMTSKRRAELRGMANRLEPLFHVGKSGVTPAVIAQTNDVFNTRELIKIKVLLESAPEKPREIAEKIAKDTEAQVVQVIGGSIILYKENPNIENGVKKKKSADKKKSGVGKGAKDFKKIYNARKKKDEERQAAERARYSRNRRRNFNGGYSK